MKPDTLAACQIARHALENAHGLLQRDSLEAILANDPPDLVRHYADLREEADVMRETMTELSKMEQQLSYESIPACFDAHGIQNVRVQGYGLVGLTRRWSCSMLDKETGLKWLRDHGQGGMIQETVNAQTLGAWAREETEEKGVEPPDDVFKISVARSVTLKRSR